MTLGYPTTGPGARAADLEPWSGEVPRDQFFWISQINKATFLLNSREGLLPAERAPEWARAQRRVIEKGNTPGNLRPRMYVRYEPLLVKEAGIDVTVYHAGRSSQDMHAVFERTMLRDEFLKVAEAMGEVRSALLSLAEANRETIAPCYTNGVAAQPSSLGHTWLGHLEGFSRDFENLREFYARLNRSPMGTCVLNGTCFPVNRRDMAAYLGFDGLVDNAYDAGQISTTDIMVEAALKLISPMLHVTQFIQDVMVQYAQPRPWILVSAVYASSAMPQKRNPGSLIDVRRDANAVIGETQSVIFRAHDLTPGMYDAKDEHMNCAIYADAAAVLRAFAGVLRLLRVDAARAEEELNLDWTASQNVADVLMQRFGVPFRAGHHFASNLVTVARREGYTPKTLPFAVAREVYARMAAEPGMEDIPAELPLDETGFRSALDPRSIVNARQSEGGPQPAELERLFREMTARVEADGAWTAAAKAKLARAEERLDRDFDALCDGSAR